MPQERGAAPQNKREHVIAGAYSVVHCVLHVAESARDVGHVRLHPGRS